MHSSPFSERGSVQLDSEGFFSRLRGRVGHSAQSAFAYASKYENAKARLSHASLKCKLSSSRMWIGNMSTPKVPPLQVASTFCVCLSKTLPHQASLSASLSQRSLIMAHWPFVERGAFPACIGREKTQGPNQQLQLFGVRHFGHVMDVGCGVDFALAQQGFDIGFDGVGVI